MTTKYDLHCHSTASDGSLAPSEVIARAKKMGVTSIALTDHDTTNGLVEATKAAIKNKINLIPGIEISTTWENKCFHIIGLNINPTQSALVNGIKKLQTLRAERTKKISLKLEKEHIPNAYESVLKAAKGGMITRSHFADFLLSKKYIATKQEAFNRYLGVGKSAYVSTIWANLDDAINWINQAGGTAVIAHPLNYKMTASGMKRFLSFFKDSGGQGIEVVTGRSTRDGIKRSTTYAEQYGLAASTGSDFHYPSDQGVELGHLLDLPKNVKPVWELFN